MQPRSQGFGADPAAVYDLCMIRHVVMFKWSDDVDEAHIAAVAEGLDGLVAGIPEIHAYAHGGDLGLADGNYDYAVVGDFQSEADYVVYRDHPIHKEFIGNLIAGRITDRAAVQYAT